ncbi:MAG: dihydrodipicolinate reductase [Novosphingobium sp.]|nr:dihydrodipicolinate reductase [Novosphingobium sp.]
MDKLRVIQWNTGKVGKLALRAILDDPRLELVGVFAHSPDKTGKDAGELCGRPATGITATDDIDALIALGADSVLYTPFEGNVDHAVRLLEGGMDVVSTNLFLHSGGVQGEVRERLDAAAQQGGSSLYITGINPGWVNAITAAMTAVCRQVESVTLVESADCSVYESIETWGFLGIGEPGGMTPELMERARSWLILFKDAVLRVGDALGYTFDDIDFFCEYATASQTVDLGWLKMEQGTNAALRGGWNGKIGGKTVINLTVVWYLTKHLAEGWDIDDDQYHLTIVGEPNIDTRIRFTPPAHWKNHDWDTMTALPAVSALFDIKAARPGVLGLRDVGLPHAPAGVWAAK